MDSVDTIGAIITALGGAVGVIRVSGPEAFALGGRVWHGTSGLESLESRRLVLGELRDGSGRVLDPECLAVRMPGPHSYTGEDVVELHCHGGALCVRLGLAALVAAGVRLAEPGEFTKRAFLNGRMDLTQAEAVADVVAAGSASALRLAGRQLKGRLGMRINSCYDALSNLLSDIESRLDFPEEEIDWSPAEDLCAMASGCLSEMRELLATRRTGEILRGGLGLVIAGCPNVGKSSLLNYLLGRDRAIVTDEPGTTRDTLEERLVIRGIPVRLIDTAGIRSGGGAVERQGMERSRESAEQADVVLWLFDGTQDYDGQGWPEWPVSGQVLLVANKCDVRQGEKAPCLPADALQISARTGQGMEGLFAAIERVAGDGFQADGAAEVAVASRHAALLEDACGSLTGALADLRTGAWELASLGIRGAVGNLGRIVGREVEPDVLETIFSKFCIGK